MNYVWIFVGSYALVCLAFLRSEMRRARSRRGRQEVMRDPESFSLTVLTFTWGTFFTGSILGGLAAGSYWLIASLMA